MKVNPRQMEKMMKQMGMSQVPIEADEVIIRKSDGSEIVITSPDVQKIKMMGQESFQITGNIEERSGEKFSNEDAKMVAEQACVSEEEATKALEEFGDIAEAILHLKKD
ncbi:MAG: nascent polypeptide-associated complex protein [Candidatus Aenigmarchaeota archaeon]|nr:nascent polypeptide-associated complex protein [Candidatus Aenigmarchaeota archaeon]